MEIIILAGLGLIFGSFTDALTWRLHKQAEVASQPKKKADKDYSMMTGRSMCESCQHELGPLDLIPLFSWVSLGGKCRYCMAKISKQSPSIEVLMSVAFVALYVFWPFELIDTASYVLFGMWLVYVVGLVAMAVYDLRWLLIPNRIILPLIALATAYTAVDALVFDGGAERVREAVLGLGVGGGLFYVLFQVSSGRWIGGGDVKLGFFLGIVLGPAKALVALYVSFTAALVVVLPLMIARKVTRKSRIPFGPFLIFAILFAQLFGQAILDWYDSVVLIG